MGEAEEVAVEMLSGSMDDLAIAVVLTALRARGESFEEVAGFASALRRLAVRVEHGYKVLDTAGTGGDGYNTINASTISALVAAYTGAVVAKHGNRSVSSRSGSADFLEALGYRITHDASTAVCMLAKYRFTFLYAPQYHKLMARVMGVRRRLGVRTIFNLVGPLSNPANPAYQVLGVAGRRLARVLAEAASSLGYERAVIVHGEPGSGGWPGCRGVQPRAEGYRIQALQGEGASCRGARGECWKVPEGCTGRG